MYEQLLSGGIAASLVGSIYGLIKLVTYLIQRAKTEHLPEARNAMPEQQAAEIHAMFMTMVEQKIQWDYLRSDIKSIRDGQDVINSRINELINGMSRVTDKLVDLIDRIDRGLINH
jgi:uncharacterized coiled-coil DUF342 family protein